MKNKFTILGCGSSLGSPWITNYWGNCKKTNKKNLRTRCCAHFQYKNISTLIDTSPDLKTQFLKKSTEYSNLIETDQVISAYVVFRSMEGQQRMLSAYNYNWLSRSCLIKCCKK